MYVLQKLLTIFLAQWNIQSHFTKLQIPLKVTPITQQIEYVWVNLELARCTVFISVLFYVNMWRIYVFNRPQLQLSNICCIALNASLCSSLEHVLAFKMCSMKNICVQVLHTGSVQYYRTRSMCSISVALLVFKLCSIPEHMFLNTCKRSVPSDQLVFFLVKPYSTWCLNSVLSPLTLWCSILQNTFKAFNICCDFGVQNLNTHFYSVVFDLFCISG